MSTKQVMGKHLATKALELTPEIGSALPGADEALKVWTGPAVLT